MPRTTDIDNPTQSPVLSDNLTIPPGSPTAGDRYIIAGTSGDWSAFTIGDIVEFVAGNEWYGVTPQEGWDVYVKSLSKYKTWTGSAWTQSAGGVTNLEGLSDIGSATPTKYNIFLANGTLFNSNSIRELRSLAVNYAKTHYREVTRASGKVSVIAFWTNNAKTTKVLEETITRSAGKVSGIATVLYDTNGTTVLETFTETITRDGNGKYLSSELVLS